MTEKELQEKITTLTKTVVDSEDLKIILSYALMLSRAIGVMTAWVKTKEAHQSLLDDLCAEMTSSGKEAWEDFSAHIKTVHLLEKIQNKRNGNA